ncbi:NAD(P)/FAD-dependent oxidoreductase [Chondromyces apiculatus]|uniref:Sarcosine oxidase beta subunit n=1 Tax=Chondromyces apiculatus DSM 436 TaxID=1192034 RepID=A0A017SWZ1_9BACT|nr:FAD-binding oxidoreductase [Chondromyces apiculatus]EYF01292.1 Sarcosine oxidase beta subunit [Chondromyces apiculatus DSM 436]
MRDRAEVVIIGAGIMGLAIAYNLARHHGITDVVVLDESYLCGGASGRNGGGVRAQFSSADNIQLMQESIRLCRDFAQEMKINIWFRQGGYLFLVRSEEGRRMLERSVAVQNEHGLGTRMLLPIEAQRVVPELSIEGVVAASFNPDDGVVFPWPFVWGYAHAAEKLGVEIATFTRVTGFRTQGARIDAVVTNRGEIRTHKVINAAGAWSPEIARMLGIELPNHPHRHEICSTEPLKLWLGPLVSDLSNGLYFSQSMRGEIVGGISNEDVPEGLDMGSSHRFLALYGRALTRTCPILGSVKVLRQWAGCYDLTPDANPIVGPVDEFEHFYQASGFMGHGFMMAPVMGRLLAEHVAGGPDTPLLQKWNLRRFKEGRLLTESMIIG